MWDPLRGWLRRWFMWNAMLSGVFALLWLLLRSGTKPSRFAYPCQQAAFGTATAAFGVPAVAALLSARHRLAAAFSTRVGRVCASAGLVATLAFGAWAHTSKPSALGSGPDSQPRAGYRAQLFHVLNCPQDPVGDRFVGLDNLITLMGVGGLAFYQSGVLSNFETGPDGIIAAAAVVVIKINYQWDERGGTNVDLLSGLIRRIVDHPDGFAGEVVVCENSQFNSIGGFDHVNNNAQVHSRSPHDVVVAFQGLGYTVSHYDWTVRRNTSVSEYSGGNMTDGYVVYAYDSQLNGRISYPKFRSSDGTYISLKYGIWDPAGGTYDRQKLKFINLPVLKSHHATYGATACVKHYMGVVSGNLGTNSHSAIQYGLMGALLGEIQVADLNILDCIWINANPYDGPWTTYSGATRRDQLIASTDPVAVDIWAVKNILIPAFMANGYSAPWPSPSADPDIASSNFRIYLDNAMDYILAAGYDATNDLNQIDTLTWKGNRGTPGDVNGDGFADVLDIDPFIGALLGANTVALEIMRSDMNLDLVVDGRDVGDFVVALTP